MGGDVVSDGEQARGNGRRGTRTPSPKADGSAWPARRRAPATPRASRARRDLREIVALGDQSERQATRLFLRGRSHHRGSSAASRRISCSSGARPTASTGARRSAGLDAIDRGGHRARRGRHGCREQPHRIVRPATTRGARDLLTRKLGEPGRHRDQARREIPLSTEETYRGVSGCSDWVSYQL